MRTVVAPAGPCPARLTKTDRDSVLSWASRLHEVAAEKGFHYAESAIRYFAGTIFPPSTPEYKTICGHLATMDETTIATPYQEPESVEEPVVVRKKLITVKPPSKE